MTTIVMTGSTSGFGKITARRLAATPGVDLIVGVRKVQGESASTLPLDLSRLADVRAFAGSVERRLAGAPIDGLILNAGISFDTHEQRTEDGFETTIAVNHIAHYLLLRLLLPHLADRARVIITSSGTHDPAEGTILPPPKHADVNLLAHPDRDPDGDVDPKTGGGRAYTSSKLCNVLTVNALRASPESDSKHLTVIAYDPGPTPGTGLSRNRGVVVRMLWALLGSPVGRLIPKFSSRQAAGNALAELALGTVSPPPGEYYAKLRAGSILWRPPSQLAQSREASDALWGDSAALVGLTEEESLRPASNVQFSEAVHTH